MTLLRRTTAPYQKLPNPEIYLTPDRETTRLAAATITKRPVESRGPTVYSIMLRARDGSRSASQSEIRNSKILAHPANSSAMKKSVGIGIGIGVVLLIGVFAIVFVPSREPLSLTFVQYQPWRQAAKLKLTNNSSKTIIYLTDQGGAAVLALPKTCAGWSNSLPEILTGTTTDAAGKTIPIYASAVPVFMTNRVLSHLKLLHCADLKPGESAELYVWFQVDGAPM